MSLNVTSLALGLHHSCPSASEVPFPSPFHFWCWIPNVIAPKVPPVRWISWYQEYPCVSMNVVAFVGLPHTAIEAYRQTLLQSTSTALIRHVICLPLELCTNVKPENCDSNNFVVVGRLRVKLSSVPPETKHWQVSVPIRSRDHNALQLTQNSVQIRYPHATFRLTNQTIVIT